YFGDTPLVRRAPVDATGWHVYSVDWTADLLVFRIDGREIYRVAKADVEKDGRWAFDNPKHLIVNLALGGPDPHGGDKVGAPFPGLSDGTVAAIRSEKVSILVDWVRVTQR